MTIDEFKKKYVFAENMTKNDLKMLFMFISSLLIDMALKLDDKSKIEEFFDDVKSVDFK